MRLTNVSGVSVDRVEAIAARAASLQSLEDLLTWGREDPARFSSPATLTDVVIQDEFTHDVIVRLTDGLVLVYDST